MAFALAVATGASALQAYAADAYLNASTPPALQVEVTPLGLTEAQTALLTDITLKEPAVKTALGNSSYRVLSAEFHSESDFFLKVYAYDLDQLFEITPQTITRSDERPRPTNEEFDAAIELLRNDAHLGQAMAQNAWLPYRAMPGIIDPRDSAETEDESLSTPKRAGEYSGRIIAIGLEPQSAAAEPEIVGVDLSRKRVIRYVGGAPPSTRASRSTCGHNNARQTTTPRGTPGRAEIRITDSGSSGEELWKFQVTRPSTSSGRWGSAIELHDVTYRGKPVLKQAHIPILNVLYDRNACGPYRDWQDEEDAFVAQGELRAPGILIASSKPSTILDNGDDHGNFRGIAIHTDGEQTRLVTELAAGWYRYIAEFTFHKDGSFVPRFGFTGVKNSCVCKRHHHHVYWRLDFQLGERGENIVQSSGDGRTWTDVATESKFKRTDGHKHWRILDSETGHGFRVIPSATDGIADTYGRGDIWVLKAKSGEIDDSRVYTSTAANLDAFVNSESVADQDLVVWYAGHFIHDEEAETSSAHDHWVGPRIVPIRSIQ